MDEAYRKELVRKAIHLMSLSFPIFYLATSRETALSFFVPLAVLFLLTDIGRHISPTLRTWFNALWGWLLRDHEADTERRRLNGATWVVISAALCTWLFPKNIMVTAFTILIISDMSAALIGVKYGKHRFLAKTLEGSTAFFVSAVLVIFVTPKIDSSGTEYLIGIIGAFVGTIVEASHLGLDDNLAVPLAIGACMFLLYHVLLPGTLI